MKSTHEKKPQVVMLKRGSKLKKGDFVIPQDGNVLMITSGDGDTVRGPNSFHLTEGYYFRIVWK
jgi:hypothetical protein